MSSSLRIRYCHFRVFIQSSALPSCESKKKTPLIIYSDEKSTAKPPSDTSRGKVSLKLEAEVGDLPVFDIVIFVVLFEPEVVLAAAVLEVFHQFEAINGLPVSANNSVTFRPTRDEIAVATA